MPTQNKRELPPQVLAAKLRGDTEALSAMGRAGNRNKRICAIRRALAENIAREEAEARDRNLAIIADEALEQERAEIIKRDAYRHHMANLAGASQD